MFVVLLLKDWIAIAVDACARSSTSSGGEEFVGKMKLGGLSNERKHET